MVGNDMRSMNRKAKENMKLLSIGVQRTLHLLQRFQSSPVVLRMELPIRKPCQMPK